MDQENLKVYMIEDYKNLSGASFSNDFTMTMTYHIIIKVMTVRRFLKWSITKPLDKMGFQRSFMKQIGRSLRLI